MIFWYTASAAAAVTAALLAFLTGRTAARHGLRKGLRSAVLYNGLMNTTLIAALAAFSDPWLYLVMRTSGSSGDRLLYALLLKEVCCVLVPLALGWYLTDERVLNIRYWLRLDSQSRRILWRTLRQQRREAQIARREAAFNRVPLWSPPDRSVSLQAQ